jgi:hypothetical protein
VVPGLDRRIRQTAGMADQVSWSIR